MESPDRLSSSESPLLTESEKAEKAESEEDLEHGMPEQFRYNPHHKKQHSSWWQHWIFYLLLFTAYSLALVIVSRTWNAPNPDPFLTYTPARDAVKFHKGTFDGSLGLQSLYTGEPRPEGEAAWSRLFKNYNIRFTAEEMQKMNRTALELRNGGGYYGQMSAYHHLHCLKILRRVLWYDFYNASIPDLRGHADHCIDDIRQSLMCHADLSVVTFDWQPHKRKPWPNFHLDQTCVDWDALDAWAAKRSFSLFDQKTLVHPELGISFPMVNGEIEIHENMNDDGHDVQPVWPEDSEQ